MKVNPSIEISQDSIRKAVSDTMVIERWTIDDLTEDAVVDAVLSTVLNFRSYGDAEELMQYLSASDKHQIVDAYVTALHEFVREMLVNPSESEG